MLGRRRVRPSIHTIIAPQALSSVYCCENTAVLLDIIRSPTDCTLRVTRRASATQNRFEQSSFNHGNDAPAFIQVSAATGTTCGVTNLSQVICVGEYATKLPRTALDSINGEFFTSVSAGEKHSCALTNRGRVECWGSNENGEAPPMKSPFERARQIPQTRPCNNAPRRPSNEPSRRAPFNEHPSKQTNRRARLVLLAPRVARLTSRYFADILI